MNDNNHIDWKKYLIVFLITIALFLSASYISNYFGNKKIDQLKQIQDKISIDILSSETQFSLLSELSCKNISDSVFSSELGELGNKLEWSQKNLGSTDEVSYLKKYYALLQIKDYLLSKRFLNVVKQKPHSFFIFIQLKTIAVNVRSKVLLSRLYVQSIQNFEFTLLTIVLIYLLFLRCFKYTR